MFVDELYMEKEELIARVGYCMGKVSNNVRPYERDINFPLVEILYRIYEEALTNTNVSLLGDASILLKEYKELHRDFSYSIDELIQLGWIETCFGHYHIVDHFRSFEENLVDRFEENEKDIVRFVIWTDSQECTENRFFASREFVESILGDWKRVCDVVPDISWFISNRYIENIEGNYYLGSAYGYDFHITQAMGRLWSYICERNDYEALSAKWKQMTCQLRVRPSVVQFIKGDKELANKKKLLKLIKEALDDDFCILSEEIESIKLFNAYMFHSYSDSLRKKELMDNYKPEQYRAFCKQHNYLTAESYIWQGQKKWGDWFYLGAFMDLMGLLGESELAETVGKLSKYFAYKDLDNTGLPFSEEIILELMLHKETFFYGTFALLQGIEDQKKQIGSYIVPIAYGVIKRVLQEYVRRGDFPEISDLMDTLLYLVDRYKTSSNQEMYENLWYRLYEQLLDLCFDSDLADNIIEFAPRYFSKLMGIPHSDVNYGRCFLLLTQYTDRLLTSAYYESGATEKLIQLVYNGMRKLVLDPWKASHFIDPICFSKVLSARIYDTYIETENENVKEELFDITETDDKYDLFYRYKLIFCFLTSACEGTNSCKAVDSLVNVLDKGFFEERILTYSYLAIYNLEDVLEKAIGFLEGFKDYTKGFFNRILKLDVPLLVIIDSICHDEENTRAIEQEIKRRVLEEAPEDLVPNYADERFIDCVIDCRIACLYSAVAKRLDLKLMRFSKRGNRAEEYYAIAERQRKWLLYVQGDIGELKNNDDQFFFAVLKTDSIKNMKEYEEVKELWSSILRGKEGKRYSFTSCYNYLYAISAMMKLQVEEKRSDGREDAERINLDADYRWIMDYAIKHALETWNAEYQEMFIKQALEVGHTLQIDLASIIVGVQNNARLRIENSRFISLITDSVDRSGETRVKPLLMADNARENEDIRIVQALQSYNAFDLDDKARLLAEAKGIIEDKKDWYGAFLLWTVIKTCKTMLNTIPYILDENKKVVRDIVDNNAEEKQSETDALCPHEDVISIHFRECYNMAFNELFGVCVSDQQKRSTTGNIMKRSGLPSPASVDMVVMSNNHNQELFEAFILRKDSSLDQFRDHMGKILGNNKECHSPIFMLVYCFEEQETKQNKWSKYIDYLNKSFLDDFEALQELGGIRSQITSIEESNGYVKRFIGELDELEIVRQVININNREIEIFHILIDMSFSFPKTTRKNLEK